MVDCSCATLIRLLTGWHVNKGMVQAFMYKGCTRFRSNQRRNWIQLGFFQEGFEPVTRVFVIRYLSVPVMFRLEISKLLRTSTLNVIDEPSWVLNKMIHAVVKFCRRVI